MWKGRKTDYKRKSAECSRDPSLPNALKTFYAHFETSNSNFTIRPMFSPDELPVSVSAKQVTGALRQIYSRKAAGPDNIPGQVLKECTQELTSVLTDIFNLSLSQDAVLVCWKTSSIIPLPKNSAAKSINDYRPVALILS